MYEAEEEELQRPHASSEGGGGSTHEDIDGHLSSSPSGRDERVASGEPAVGSPGLADAALTGLAEAAAAAVAAVAAAAAALPDAPPPPPAAP